MPINKGLGGFCFLKSVKDESITYFFCLDHVIFFLSFRIFNFFIVIFKKIALQKY